MRLLRPVGFTLLVILSVAGCRNQPRPNEAVGNWTFTLVGTEGEQRTGVVTIEHETDSKALSLRGEVANLDQEKRDVLFWSLIGGIDDSDLARPQLYFVYSNGNEELGVLRGDLPAAESDSLVLDYYDCAGWDKNANPTGRLEMRRSRTGEPT